MAQPRWQALLLEGIRWRHRNQPARAIECLSQSVELSRQAADLILETGTTLNYLADVHLQEGQLAQAEAAIREAIHFRLLLPPAEQTVVAEDYLILAKVLHAGGRHQEATEFGSQGLAILERRHGRRHPVVQQIRDLVASFRPRRATA